jgi:hypothetical protein
MNTTIEITKEKQKENKSNTKKENDMNTILTKEQYLETVKTFKSMFNDKSLTQKKHFTTIKTVRNNVETEQKTCIIKPSLYQLRHFIFYHMLRKKDPAATVHSIESEKYIYEMSRFNSIKEGKHLDFFIKEIQRGFPTLSPEQIRDIIRNF